MSDEKNEAAAADNTATSADELASQAWAEITGSAPDDEDNAPDADDSQGDPEEANADPEADAPADDKQSEASDDAQDGKAKTKQAEQLSAEQEHRYRSTIRARDAELRALREKMKQIAETEGPKSAPKDLDELRENFPDVVNPILNKMETLEQQIARLTEGVKTSAQLEDHRAAAFYDEQDRKVDELVPGWRDMVGSGNSSDAEKRQAAQAFWGWVRHPDSPQWVVDAAQNMTNGFDDVEEAARLLNTYRQHLGGASGAQPGSKEPESKKDAPRQRRLDGARTVASRGPQRASGTLRKDETDPDVIWRALNGG